MKGYVAFCPDFHLNLFNLIHFRQVISGKYQATTVLCTSALIRTITPRLGRILGPKGLMPSERRGTVTDNIAEYIKKLSSSTEWRGDKAGAIRMPVGKVCVLSVPPERLLTTNFKMFFPVDDVVKNVRHFLGSVKRATGNEKDTESDTKKSKGPKAGKLTQIFAPSVS